MTNNTMAGTCEHHHEQSEASPFLREFFWVQGTGFRCMAYRDDAGKWREAFYNGELPGLIRVIE